VCVCVCVRIGVLDNILIDSLISSFLLLPPPSLVMLLPCLSMSFFLSSLLAGRAFSTGRKEADRHHFAE
jgi:hypothetical protein